MKTKKKGIVILGASILTAALLISIAASIKPKVRGAENSESYQRKYPKYDINQITGEGNEPDELVGVGSSAATEKRWYEYILYSPQAVASVRVDDDRRLLFYDPYDYDSSMVMEIDDQAGDIFSSANSITISYTTGNSISNATTEGTNTSVAIQEQQGIDQSFSYSQGTSVSTTNSWSTQVGLSNTVGLSTKSSTKLSVDTGVSVTVPGPVAGVSTTTSSNVGIEEGLEISVSDNLTTSSNSSVGGQDVAGATSSETAGWSTIANRVTSSTGSSFSTNRSWSTNNSKTVSKTYNAAYFNESGAPLQWKIVHYTVYMPLKYVLQCKVDGNWITTDECYIVVKTVEGECRAYLKNSQAYIEHWGTGEPVVWGDFWKGYLTSDDLLTAYKNKLYPDNY